MKYILFLILLLVPINSFAEYVCDYTGHRCRWVPSPYDNERPCYDCNAPIYVPEYPQYIERPVDPTPYIIGDIFSGIISTLPFWFNGGGYYGGHHGGGGYRRGGGHHGGGGYRGGSHGGGNHSGGGRPGGQGNHRGGRR